MFKRFVLTGITVLLAAYLPAQSIDYDSVKQVYQTSRIDSVKLNAALELARYFRFNAPSDGIKFAQMAARLSGKLRQKKRLGEALHYEASAWYQMAEYDSAEKYNRQALAIREAIGDETGMAGTMTNLGQLLADQGRVKQGFEYLHKAEKIYEKLKDDRLLAMVYNSLGNLYYGQKVYKLAYAYHRKAFRKRQAIGDDYGLIYSYNNLGHVTWYLYGKDSAAAYYEEGVRRARMAEDVYILVQSLNNLADFYYDTQQKEKARRVLEEALAKGQGTEFENLLGNAYLNYARILFFVDNNTAKALQYAEKGSNIINRSGMVETMFHADDLLAQMYARTGRYEQAYRYQRSAFILHDSLTKDEIRQQITELEAKYENDKKQLEIRNLQNEQRLKNVELEAKNSDLERKSTLLTFFIAGSVLLVALALVVFGAYRRKKRDEQLISAQKKRVEEQNRIILHQKAEVEEKQKEIIDSINYAQRIQRALLATDTLLKENLPAHFVLFKPKDIVSGDFYWAVKKTDVPSGSDHFYLAICDSTGHGVPGAFMSLLNISYLNEAINERNLSLPHQVLDHVRGRLLQALKGEHDEGARDGMDGALLLFSGRTLYAACANNPVIIIRNNTLTELTADRMPVGRSPKDREPFTLHRFELQPGDCIYAFTDGYADQFGGENGKKFKHRSLVELLLKTHHLSPLEQQAMLEKNFENWQGKHEQLDDVLVFGIKIS